MDVELEFGGLSQVLWEEWHGMGALGVVRYIWGVKRNCGECRPESWSGLGSRCSEVVFWE